MIADDAPSPAAPSCCASSAEIDVAALSGRAGATGQTRVDGHTDDGGQTGAGAQAGAEDQTSAGDQTPARAQAGSGRHPWAAPIPQVRSRAERAILDEAGAFRMGSEVANRKSEVGGAPDRAVQAPT